MAARPEAKTPKQEPSPAPSENGWQRRAVERSTNSARLLALARSSQFLAAAMELLEESGDVDFTVLNVVERSGLSLRAFYQHFGSKDQLLISMFEELVVQFTEEVASGIESIANPFDRLEAYARAFMEKAHASRPFGGRVWAIYQMRLAADRPDDYAKSIEGQVQVLRSIVHYGVEQGAFRSDLSEMAVTMLINATLVSLAQADVFDIKASGGPIGADEVWKWCRAAVTPVAEKERPARRR